MSINPYALADLVVGRAVDWDAFPDPQKALALAFHLPAERAFAADSPLLLPHGDGSLTDTEGKKRLEAYLLQYACTDLADSLTADKSTQEIADLASSYLFPDT